MLDHFIALGGVHQGDGLVQSVDGAGRKSAQLLGSGHADGAGAHGLEALKVSGGSGNTQLQTLQVVNAVDGDVLGHMPRRFICD